MMALLVLPLLAFVAAQHDSTAAPNQQQQSNGEEPATPLEMRRAVNGTEIVLECPSAAYLVRTHMAPDFEHPQLVRRLDWIHEGALVASFHQDAGSEISQQWWVSDGRFELRRPFFELRIGPPVLPRDTGQWRCRLETDPLFAAEMPAPLLGRNAVQLVVLTKPPVPPAPSIVRHSDHSVALEWAKYAASPGHRPILRFSILVAQPEEGGGREGGSMRVLTTADNQTRVEVTGLRPNTRYAFSVRAENAVGESAFGPETVFRTVGLPPKKSPQIRSLRNGTTADCVDLEWDLPDADAEPAPIVGFRIMVHRVGSGAMREWYVKGGGARAQPLCSLDAYADYVLTLEADNGFGYSTGTTAPFRTDQSIPDGPPQLVQCRPLPGGTSLALDWRQPLQPNGPIRAFLIHFKEVPSTRAPGQIRLEVGPGEASRAFAFNLTHLAPNTRYKLRISAATDKGEGPKSEPLLVDTDFAAPGEAPKVSQLSFGCENSLLSLEWTTGAPPPVGADGLYRIAVHSSMATTTGPRVFNISVASPHKLLLDQVQVGERLSVSAQLLLRSRADPALLLAGPISAMAHFALISNGWRCRFRSSACPPAASLPPSSICEHFPEAAAAQQGAALLGQQPSGGGAMADSKMGPVDANMPFIFLVFGAAIALAISLLFGCMLRRRCLLLKSILRNKKEQKKGAANNRRGTKASGQTSAVDKWRHQNGGGTTGSGPESVSLVSRRAPAADGGAIGGGGAECISVVLPPITMASNGHCQNGGGGGGGGSDEDGGPLDGCCCSQLVEPGPSPRGPTVNVLQFEAHFAEMAADGNAGFRRQFQEIELETSLEMEECADEAGEKAMKDAEAGTMMGREKAKDRYVDIGALPKRSRIRLLDAHGRPAQDYINANFVDSCDQRRAYIATQAPLPHTFADFWAMVWQERCQVLVALTNMVECGRRKYWPERIGAQLQSGQFLVTLSAERANSVFTHRVLQLRRWRATGRTVDEEARTVHQLHFMAWPDHDVPDSPFPLLHFINYVADLQCSAAAAPSSSSPSSVPADATTTATTGVPSPCLVHCSAGVGRSGAFILIDSLRRHLLRCDRIDVCGQLRRMRRQRAQLVQTLDQFVFCHEVLRHLVANGISRQPRSHFPNYCHFLFTKCTPAGLPRIQAQFQELLACPHGPPGCAALPAAAARSSPLFLPGYHRVDEFLLLFPPPSGTVPLNSGAILADEQLWLDIWEAKCQSLAILDSRGIAADLAELMAPLASSSRFGIEQRLRRNKGENDDGEGRKEGKRRIWVELVGRSQVLMRGTRAAASKDGGGGSREEDGEEDENEELLPVNIHRICTAALLANPWAEIERLQVELQDQHRGKLALLELRSPCRRRPTAAPFIFAALQSAACQLEQEGAVDVLLWLASYRHAVCGCWTDLAEIELIYRRVLELVEMQRSLC